jgi:PKD repeat protein
VEVGGECEVDFTAEPTEGCAEVTVYFGAFANELCDISSYEWDFGDPASGPANTASGQDAEHTYTASGQYTVTLSAYDAGGTIEVVKTNFITVYDVPTAGFTATPTSGQAPLTVSFTDQSLDGGLSLTYAWDFGDPSSSNNTSTDQNLHGSSDRFE